MIEDMDGLFNRMPRLAMCMIVGIAGMFLAPFGMLIAKWSALKASIDENNVLLILFIIVVLFIVLIVFVVLVLLVISVVIHCFHLLMSDISNTLVHVVHSEYSLSHLRKAIHSFKRLLERKMLCC